jgi:ribosomal protein S18 acetylase RimI-like enzyme
LQSQFRQVVEQTYRASLDCPELDGLRPIEDVFDGYRAAGAFQATHWSLAQREGEFVGVVLLANFPELQEVVLQYMGVVPAHRRRGIGRELVEHALRIAKGSGAKRLSLAVDDRNIYARRLYDQMGFTQLARRDAFIFVVRRGTTLDV